MGDRDVDTIETVTVVGGGDAGLLAALLLRNQNPGVTITVVDDFDEAVVEVGKSTISYIQHTLHEVLGIDTARFISAVKPVWKASVYFTDWCGRGPFHVPFDDLTLAPPDPGPRRFEELYYRYERGNFRTMGVEIAERGVSPFVELRESGYFRTYDHVAYHLGTNRFNEFLRELCAERRIDLIDDEIVDVRSRGDRIERIESDTTAYESDLYVDATGFERLLMRTLDNAFVEFDFPLDSAVVAKTEVSLSEIVPATVVNSGDHGWFWQIDTYDWRDVGYVYSSEHVSDDRAAAEFIAEKEGVVSADDVTRYRFDSGLYRDAWMGNCVAVGNALGFVEPLQSTALTLNAILVEKLSELLADHRRINHRGVRNVYNEYSRRLWDNVYDFISVHYRYSSGDTEFWEAMQSVNEDETLARYTESYRENGFSSHEEIGDQVGPVRRVFNQYIFYRVLRSLGVRSEFYDTIDVDVSPDVRRDVERREERIREDVDDHLSYEEVYGSGVF